MVRSERPVQAWGTSGDNAVKHPRAANAEPSPEGDEMETRILTREEVVERVTETARRAGLTFEEFMADGPADTLTDGDCRDDWLIYRDFLIEP